MTDVALIQKSLSPAQTVARVAAAQPSEVALAKAAIGVPPLAGQASLLAPDAAQAANALFAITPRVQPFKY